MYQTDFKAHYRNFFQTIGRPLTVGDAFPMEDWPENGVTLPIAIKDFYEVAGKAYDFISGFRSPWEWGRGDEVTIISDHNEGGSSSAYKNEDEGLEDPLVWQVSRGTGLLSPQKIRWSEYILLTLCTQTFWAMESIMPFRDRALFEVKMVERISQTWNQVAHFKTTPWIAFIRPHCVLCIMDWYNEPSILLSAQDQQHFETSKGDLGLDWIGYVWEGDNEVLLD